MFDLPETITVWAKSANDGFGGFTWSAPATYDARIAHKQDKFVDDQGNQLISSAVCYSEGAALAAGVLVYFGTSTDLSPPATANDVRALSQTPSGAGDLKKCWFA